MVAKVRQSLMWIHCCLSESRVLGNAGQQQGLHSSLWQDYEETLETPRGETRNPSRTPWRVDQTQWGQLKLKDWRIRQIWSIQREPHHFKRSNSYRQEDQCEERSQDESREITRVRAHSENGKIWKEERIRNHSDCQYKLGCCAWE